MSEAESGSWIRPTRVIVSGKPCATPEMAEAALRDEMKKIDEGRHLDKKFEPTMTFGQLAAAYLKSWEKRKLKSIDKERSLVKRLSEYFGDSTNIGDISSGKIERFKTERLGSKGKNTPTIGITSVNRQLSCLKRMFKHAISLEQLEENPARSVKPYKERSGRIRYLDLEEMERLIDACSDTLRPIVLMALHTGMRKSEIFNLRWEQIVWKESLIEIPDQKNGEQSFIPMNQTVKNTLSSIVRRIDSPYVFARLPAKRPIQRADRKNPKKHAPTDGFAPVDVKKAFKKALGFRSS